ncbi:tetratricopeptide repeat protein [Paraflavitalea soli]|uniref:Tetratricopeptide repeat protein n=1 Tax=Paraflavitalea soli TaxID=2315862 RepID=A0A3B7MUH2_9BACT|nr:tetratricopeptide repeat protein [Paraflavitalea soli]AXY74121.1 tetratricopeptide repeat protein [Paraflavitalea soli]
MAVRYSSHNLHVRAKEAEQAGEPAQAVKLYTQALKNDPMDDISYNRLMVHYRRQKDYQKELKIIQAAIAAHLHHAQQTGEQWLKKNKQTARTARALVKSLGLVDRKGMPKLETRQIETWQKRMGIVRKRIRQSAARK